MVQLNNDGECKDLENDQDNLLKKILLQLSKEEEDIFQNLAALSPEEEYKLGAKSWIDIPDLENNFIEEAKKIEARMKTYETIFDYDLEEGA